MSRKDEILRLRQVLRNRRDARRKALAGDMSSLGSSQMQYPPQDAADDAADSERHNVGAQLAEAESDELNRIEAALERMRNNTFGICATCKKPIPMARLNALPYAKRCIKCQREADREKAGAV